MLGVLARNGSDDFVNLNRMINKNAKNPAYWVKSNEFKFHRKLLEELVKMRDEILDRKTEGKPSPLQLQESAKRLKKTP